jgi:hypothetical protein
LDRGNFAFPPTEPYLRIHHHGRPTSALQD